MKSNKGVTLVALVVTIIVLLILAGVTINMVAGQNGIMTKASTAKTTQLVATFKEAISTGVSALAADEQEAAAMGGDAPNAKTIEDAIKKDIDNALKNVTITFTRPSAGTPPTEKADDGTYATGEKLKLKVDDAASGSTLKSANIDYIEVEIEPASWEMGDGVVQYVKKVDDKTNTTF